MTTTEILHQIDAEILRLQQARAILSQVPNAGAKRSVGRPKKAVAVPTKHSRKPLSADAKARIAAAQKARWAKTKKASTKSAAR